MLKMSKRGRTRTLVVGGVLTLAITLLQSWGYTHPSDDGLERSIATKNFRMTAVTYHNRHANRCVIVRTGDTETPRTVHKTRCDVLYIKVTKSSTNMSKELCAVDYIVAEWDALSRTYNDGITYIHNDYVINDAPLTRKLHVSGRTRVRDGWFSMIPFNGGLGMLRQWVKSGKLRNSCEHGAVECHNKIVRYSCDGARNYGACIGKDYGVFVVRGLVIAACVVLVLWRLRGFGRVLRGGRHATLEVSPMIIFSILGVVAFIGMNMVDMIWIASSMFGLRFSHTFNNGLLKEGDIYRQGNIRGVYEGYAYVWNDGEEGVRVSGPGVTAVVGIVTMGLFLKRALLMGLLIRCCFGVVGVFAGCAVVEVMLTKTERRDEGDEYLPAEIARRYAKRYSRSDRVFVRGRK